jgi:hypothetical protein
MTKEDRGVLLFDTKEPKVSGYLIIGKDQYWIVGHKVSETRTNLTLRKAEVEPEPDLFDDRSGVSGERKCDLA